MTPSALFYISGHGFGHARRVAQVIRELRRIAPEMPLSVRTTAPQRIFEPIDPAHFASTELDAGMAELDPLHIDAEASLQRLERLVARKQAIIDSEAAALRGIRPSVVISDIPFLAGDVAEACGIPCLGMSNFTWDWICDGLFERHPHLAARYAAVRPHMLEGYGKMAAALRLPFGGLSEAFQKVIDVPLVAAKGTASPADVRRKLNIGSSDLRPRILFGMRGGLGTAALLTAAAASPDFLFLCPYAINAPLPANVLLAPLGPFLDFSDLLLISDAVVSKLGYSLVAECLATRVRMLWPRRIVFREDFIVERDAPRYIPMRELNVADFTSGRWREGLRELMAVPMPEERCPAEGATACAKAILAAATGAPADR